jgi:hypothetical protein
MPIDINWLRADKGGDVARWRENCRKRNKSEELINTVTALDTVSFVNTPHIFSMLSPIITLPPSPPPNIPTSILIIEMA